MFPVSPKKIAVIQHLDRSLLQAASAEQRYHAQRPPPHMSRTVVSAGSPRRKSGSALKFQDKDDDELVSYNGVRPPSTSDLSNFFVLSQSHRRALKNDTVITYWIEDGRVLLYKGRVLNFSKYNFPWAFIEYTGGSTSFYYLGQSEHNKTWRHAQDDDDDVRDVGEAPKKRSVAKKPAKSRGAKKAGAKVKDDPKDVTAGSDIRIKARALRAFEM